MTGAGSSTRCLCSRAIENVPTLKNKGRGGCAATSLVGGDAVASLEIKKAPRARDGVPERLARVQA